MRQSLTYKRIKNKTVTNTKKSVKKVKSIKKGSKNS